MSENGERATSSRRFRSTEHLSLEAIAAYADGELKISAHLRAARHLTECPDCAAEVEWQRHASGELRRLPQVAMPDALLGTLNRIPLGDPDPAPAPGPAEPSDSRRWSRRWRK